MLDTPAKLKRFITWCQENKVKSFKNKELEFELSELAFLPKTEGIKEINLNDEKVFADTESMTEEEKNELLFWSSN